MHAKKLHISEKCSKRVSIKIIQNAKYAKTKGHLRETLRKEVFSLLSFYIKIDTFGLKVS